MLAEMYKKREKLAYVFLVGTLASALIFFIFATPKTPSDWVELLFFLFPIGLSIAIVLISRAHYKKVKDIEIPQSEKQLLELKDIVIKKDAALIPRLLLFEKSGQYVGSVEIAKTSWWVYPFLFFASSLISLFPMTYKLASNDGTSEITFRKTGWLKQSKVEIFNKEQKKIGTYIQEELKALFNIRGVLYDEEEEAVLSIKASGFSGSFSWNDQQGRRLAYFYNGMFPHEYTHLFRDTHNDIVELAEDTADKDKIRLLAVIGFIFFTRIEQ
ncbi:hypothetical protein KQ939_09325 [Planococcus sp. CP5-4]|uniref:hypothetical protein n=1 Tax=unclassified Planococcus (in: firmicutes) TaxID=2662419 RepID=UPI001C23C97C|nr:MULTISPECIES: hypothetical protein [unclassified Planococcus (in: firmicutes)]MBU9674768.1 hypothetical protein [Planococcus sp. CP5-4_YE]MBV0908864.1 hypothetical protein [Planococcus sp. CP5-4_UN]MBW6063913.1 hypothetical protein [Planococcus sp. CP5-4]